MAGPTPCEFQNPKEWPQRSGNIVSAVFSAENIVPGFFGFYLSTYLPCFDAKGRSSQPMEGTE